ncbi:hypothetical protein JCM19379_20740 [Methyloparacoccus murrellii]
MPTTLMPDMMGYLPHSVCLLRDPVLMALHIVADGLITLAYVVIPIALGLFVQRRRDFAFTHIFILFATFILACAATHAMDIWTLWSPDYLLEGGIKAFTALVSLATAILVWPVLDKALAGTARLAATNARLTEEIASHQQTLADVRAEAQRRRILEQQLRTVMDNAADAIVTTDDTGHIVLGNPATANMFGYTAEELLGRPLADLLASDPAAPPEDRTGGPGGAHGVEFIGLRKDGSTFPLEMTLGGHTCVLRDISPRKEREQLIRELNDRLQREVAERTEQLAIASAAKSQFLANMSHEIRTPMNAILGFTQLLEHDPQRADQRETLGKIRAAGEALLRIIDDILDIARIEAGRIQLQSQPFEPAALLHRLVDQLRDQAHEKGLQLQLEIAPGLTAPLLGDSLRLQQVLGNLVSNAIKFTERGQVSIAVRATGDAPRETRLRFEVRDTGIGIARPVQARIFSPFSQADGSITRRHGGTGLGLAICRHLVELMGGIIGVDSQIGAGSTFWFEVPFELATGSCAAATPSSSPAPILDPSLKGLRVLVVDDSAMNRTLLEKVLRQQGAWVMLASDGQQALNLLRAKPEDFDVVLMDIQMPVMDGLSATRAIRADARLGRVPVIALTAVALAEERTAAEAAGMDGFLTKPIDLAQLIGALLAHYPETAPAAAVEARPEPLPPVTGDALPSIAGIDAQRAALATGNDPAFFVKMLGLFVDEFEDADNSLRADLARGDRESATRRLHNLRGNAGNLGATELAEIARRLEATLPQQPADLAAQLDAFRQALHALVAASRPWLHHAATPTADTSGITPEQLKFLRVALSRHDLAAIRLYTDLGPALRDRHDAESIGQLDQSVAALDFDKALAWLEQYEPGD